MITTLPNPKDVRDLYNDLLGRDVEVKAVNFWAPKPIDWPSAAEFVDDMGRLQAIVALDLSLAVFTGAAIGLVPAAGAKDMIDEHYPSEMVLGNLYEVLNVLTSIFNTAENPHVKITTMHKPGASLPTELATALARPAGRLDLEVEIAGYGSGRLALVAA